MNRRLFLLGGMDLEMQTIKDVLQDTGESFVGYRLHWNNAKLSAYSDILYSSDSEVVYGIELKEDIACPQYYVRIDHHNDYADRPSSLHQICGILGVTMNRRLQLISANDSSYIPGMERLGATKDEICEIRLADRRAQGVTAKDEENAAYSIEHYLRRERDVTIVRSLSRSFSPIVDRLYPYNRLIIYRSGEITCYGFELSFLKSLFNDDAHRDACYYGGGEHGFWGLAEGYFTEEQIKKNISKTLLSI